LPYYRSALASLALTLLASSALAAAKPDPKLHDAALEVLKKSISFRTVKGGGQTGAYAEYLKGVLVAGGFTASDITIEPLGDTAFLIARYRGTDPGKKPIVLSGHMDVVEARREDWSRDPFTPIVDGKYIYGRGSSDDKFDVSLVTVLLAKLKREGWKPSRDVVLALSGDEETTMATTAVLAQRLGNAELVLNIDGGGGELKDGKAVAYGIQGAEKTYADFALAVTDPGGHSSRPTRTNAIYRLAKALDRIAAYEFPVMSNEITRGELAAAASSNPGPLGDAMKRFAADPTDKAAIATLSADINYYPALHTTCVTTMVSGGHATNALPQKAEANVNCRIFPGTPAEQVRLELTRVVADPSVTITRSADGSIDSPASPMRPDVVAAVGKAVHATWPGVPVVPSMSYGASDSMYFRAAGIPSYGVSGMFSENGETFAHGLNEKAPLAAIDGTLVHYEILLRELAK
jgi:carboxypeptidase PM20D1